MSDPIPPADWEEHFGSGPRPAPEDAVPPRPDVVQVTRTDGAGEDESRTAAHPGSGLPEETPPLPAPQPRPGEQPRPMWRRPPGQQDDKGEPTRG
ncbi:hypothetical protein JL475_29765 [Streptomyces sp. M2CJ-2]|uniref:hypothetical protein n=1 Tax=Streptomyces sp. M2CJ-2 TaxID=2803948 RepID=UPI001928008D|nr:hypothetical protein [Streptomyces sp. M2CJ-2]MBL3670095.1 hypothetical protein [Streptomyces sp. M2CJ-2]